MPSLAAMAEAVGDLLKARRETVAVAESSTGGLIAAALLAAPGASAYFVGGGVIYTHKAREVLLEVDLARHPGMRPSTEAYALLEASAIRARLGRPGASARPARPARPATATATPRATAASPSPARAAVVSLWRPRNPTARSTCGASPRRR